MRERDESESKSEPVSKRDREKIYFLLGTTWMYFLGRRESEREGSIENTFYREHILQ